MEKFLNRNGIFYQFQSNVKENYSRLIQWKAYFTGNIAAEFKKGSFTGMILNDLQKAFDAIDN